MYVLEIYHRAHQNGAIFQEEVDYAIPLSNKHIAKINKRVEIYVHGNSQDGKGRLEDQVLIQVV